MKLSMSRWTFLVIHHNSIIHLFYEGVSPSNRCLAQISRRFAKLFFLGHVHMSTLSWDRLLSFCRLNLSIKLFPLCSLNISSTAVECRMVVF